MDMASWSSWIVVVEGARLSGGSGGSAGGEDGLSWLSSAALTMSISSSSSYVVTGEYEDGAAGERRGCSGCSFSGVSRPGNGAVGGGRDIGTGSAGGCSTSSSFSSCSSTACLVGTATDVTCCMEGWISGVRLSGGVLRARLFGLGLGFSAGALIRLLFDARVAIPSESPMFVEFADCDVKEVSEIL